MQMKKMNVKIFIFKLLLAGIFITLSLADEVKASAVNKQSAEPVLLDIYIKEAPIKTNYDMGELLDITGLQVYGKFDGEEDKQIYPDKIEGFEGKPGKNTIKVYYNEFSVSFDVIVNPAKVSDFKVKESTKSSLVLDWKESENASGYEIYRFNKETNGYELETVSTDLSYTLSGLTSGSAHRFLIRPFFELEGNKYFGPYSDMLEAGTRPNKVDGLVVTKTEERGITLQWDPVEGEVKYIIYRYYPKTSEFKKIATTAVTRYDDINLSLATQYSYMVCAYTSTEEFYGEHSNVVKAMTKPRTPSLAVKNGDHRVRLTWNKIKEADGYILLMASPNDLIYREIARIQNVSILEYVHKGLDENARYRFKIQAYKVSEDSLVSESEMSPEKSILITKFLGTSIKASNYATIKKFKQSPAYKNYKKFRKALNLTQSFVIPGIKSTNVDGFMSKNMCPQAITIAGPYLLMTAYDRKKEERSVVYVLDQRTKRYITTIALPDKYHVGGIAFDGTNIWVAAGSMVSSFKYSGVKAAVRSGQDSYPVNYTSTNMIKTKASFLTYYKKCLWVGENNEKKTGNMYSYRITGKKKVPKLNVRNRIEVPAKTQGVTFLKDGTMVFACSNQISSAHSSLYTSQLRFYKPSWKKQSITGFIKKNQCKRVVTMPPMVEGIVTKGSNVYAVFESAAFPQSKEPIDRICVLKTSVLKKK